MTPHWRVEAARAGIKPWPYCRRTMANLDGRAVEVPELDDADVLAAFDRRLAIRMGATPSQASEGVVVDVGRRTIGAGSMTNEGGWPWSADLPRVEEEPFDPYLVRIAAWRMA